MHIIIKLKNMSNNVLRIFMLKEIKYLFLINFKKFLLNLKVKIPSHPWVTLKEIYFILHYLK